MLHNLRKLLRYRGLIQSLVARELKARYRGSVLGFFWSFINPLLLLLIYTFVFAVVMPGARGGGTEPYALFMFCGILPWTWFSSSLSEAANVLISGGNLIKKVLFPAEILPIVTVLANMVHFFLGLPILVMFLIYYRAPLTVGELVWFPVVVFDPVPADDGAGADSRGADGALPRHPGHPEQPAHVLVLRDADHLSDEGRAGVGAAVPQSESVHAPGHFVSGDPVLSRRRSGTGSGCSRRAPDRWCCFSPAISCSIGSAIRSPRKCDE